MEPYQYPPLKVKHTTKILIPQFLSPGIAFQLSSKQKNGFGMFSNNLKTNTGKSHFTPFIFAQFHLKIYTT
jgi:hypothetical protein